MYRKTQQSLLIVTFGIIATIVFLGVVILSPATQGVAAQTAPQESAADSPFVTTFPLGVAGAPRNLIQVGDDFWFTAPGVNAIGRLVVNSAVDFDYHFYTIDTPNSDPYDLAWDGESVWFTERAGNKVGKLDVASGTIVEYPVPTANSEPTGIAVTADGLVWFAERAGNALGVFNSATEQFTEHQYSQPNALPEDVAALPTGDVVWFTAPGVDRLVRYHRGTGELDGYPTYDQFLATFYTPSQIAVDRQGNPWVSTKNGKIGRYAYATYQNFRWFRVGPDSAEIDGLVWMPEGTRNTVWFSESNTGMVGQLVTTGDGTTVNKWRFPVTGEGGKPFGVVADGDTVWVADSGNNLLLRWSPPYFYSTYLPTLLTAE